VEACQISYPVYFKGEKMSQPTTPAPAAATATAKPPRSPVERAIVWGVIGVGILVIAVEAQAHLSHSAALSKLQEQISANSEKDAGVTKKDVDKVVGGKIPEQQKLGALDTSMSADHVDIYSYPGLLRQRKIYVYYGIAGKHKSQEAEVLDVLPTPAETAAQAQAKLPPPDPNAKPVAPAGMTGMPGGPGRGGPGAGGRGGPEGAARKSRPGTEDDAAKKDETKSADEKPADDNKSDADAKPAEEAKPAETKPDTEKPAEPEPKKE